MRKIRKIEKKSNQSKRLKGICEIKLVFAPNPEPTDIEKSEKMKKLHVIILLIMDAIQSHLERQTIFLFLSVWFFAYCQLK